MSIAEMQTEPVIARSESVGRILLWAGMVAFGFAPLLIRFGGEQWARPHYQFFPLMILAAVFVAWQRIHELPKGEITPGRPAIAHAMLTLSLAMLLAAAVLWSGRLAAATVMLSLVAFFWRVGGWRMLRELLPAGILLALIIGPPVGIADDLLQGLREIAVWTSSRVLLWLGVIHTETGTVLEIPGKRLLVAEACSGINSMMAVLGFTLVLTFIRRRDFRHTLILIAACVVFVLWANTVRIAGGVWLQANHDIDILTGGAHEWASVVLFCVCMALIFSMDLLITLVRNQLRHRFHHWPRRTLAQPKPVRPGPANRFHLTRAMWLLAAMFSALGIAQLSNAAMRGGVGAWLSGSGATSLKVGAYFDAPAELAGWQRSPEAEKLLMQPELEAKFSQSWIYKRGETAAIVAIDYPFPGYHDLAVCYINAGWTIDRLLSERDPQSGPFARAFLSRLNEKGYFWFSLINEQGEWVERPRTDAVGRVLDRFQHTGPPNWSAPTYQIQVWIQRYDELNEQQQAEVADLFLAARSHLAANLMQQLGEQ